MSFFSSIKAFWNAVFGTGKPVAGYNLDNLISEKMAAHIQLVSALYENNVKEIPWISKQRADENIKSLGLAVVIPREIARIACSEAKIRVDGNSERAKYLNSQLEKLLDVLQNKTELGLLYGNIAFKPYFSNGEMNIDVSRIGRYIPAKINERGEVIAAIFVSSLTRNDTVYTKLEYHHMEADGVYIVENTAYESNTFSGSIGKKIDLATVDEWKDIAPYVAMSGVDRPLFSVYTNPFANNVDVESPLGCSILANCIEFLEEADKTWEEIRYEMKSGERRVYATAAALRTFGNTGFLSRFYKKFEADTDDFFQDYSPAIRTEVMERRQQSIYKRIEQNAGLSFGIISDPDAVDKTATEIINGKQRLHSTVISVQKSMKTAIGRLVEAMDVFADLYGITPRGEYSFVCDWDDSIIETKQDKQNRAALERQQGLIDDVEYFVQTKDFSEEEAIAYVDKMKKRTPEIEGAEWFKQR